MSQPRQKAFAPNYTLGFQHPVLEATAYPAGYAARFRLGGDVTGPIAPALTLTRMAVALLDAADPLDEGLAALRLQMAIDAVEEVLGGWGSEPPPYIGRLISS